MTYVPVHPRYDHQEKAYDRMYGREFFALLMAMRTGKTKTVLDEFGSLCDEGRVEDLLVVAPAGVYKTWATAIKDHMDPFFVEGLQIWLWEAKDQGRGVQKRLEAFLASRAPRVLLINVEALSSVKRARELALTFASQRRCYVAVDESTKIKNVMSERTKFCVLQLSPRAKFRRILSGLVAPNSPLDVYAQFSFLKRGLLGDNWFSFRARYAIIKRQFMPKDKNNPEAGGHWVNMVVGYRDEDELASRLEPHRYRVRLEDTYGMPPSTFSIRNVELTDEQRRIYRELKEYSTAELESESYVTPTIALTKLLRLHQVVNGHTTDDDGNFKIIPENRTEAVLDILEDYDGKAIIWCAYDHSLRSVVEALRSEYGTNSVARFWGGNRATREDEERRFKTSSECRFMVATASAGGMGRTWDNADLVVYHSSTENLEHRSQSEERPKNVGKDRPIAYVDLVTEGTVDVKILHALRNKINLSSVLQGDAWREWVV